MRKKNHFHLFMKTQHKIRFCLSGIEVLNSYSQVADCISLYVITQIGHKNLIGN